MIDCISYFLKNNFWGLNFTYVNVEWRKLMIKFTVKWSFFQPQTLTCVDINEKLTAAQRTKSMWSSHAVSNLWLLEYVTHCIINC